MKLLQHFRNAPAFSIALAISIAVHAVLLTIRFVSPETFNRMFSELPLEVILVNAETETKPEKAKAFAQVAMDGGGEAASGRATSPLPYSAMTSMGDEAENAEPQEVASTRQVQNNLLAQLQQQIADIPPLDPEKAEHSEAELAQEEKRLHLLRMLAEIERDVKTENERPRKRFFSPTTQDSVMAMYLNQVRNTISTRGTENFPTQDGKPLYGTLIMQVLINHDGRVLETEIINGSGNPALDRRAEAIVHAAAPYGFFTQDMRKTTDQLGFVSTFEFRRDATMRMQMQELQRPGSAG